MSTEILIVDGAQYQIRFFQEVAKALFGPQGNAVKTSKNPRFIIYSHWGQEHKKYVGKKRLVFVSGEPSSVTHKRYCLLLDTKDVPHLRAAKGNFELLPFYVLSFWERHLHVPNDLLTPLTTVPVKTKFCVFMYSHAVGFRDALFDAVCKYKKVDGIGKCRNNCPPETDRRLYTESVTFYDTAVEKYKPYKFVICCENSKHKGYITEKVINARLARSIPIYLGAPDVVSHFNPKAFVDASKPDFIDQIKALDTDPVLYENMLRESWFIGGQLPAYFDPKYTAEILRKRVLLGSK